LTKRSLENAVKPKFRKRVYDVRWIGFWGRGKRCMDALLGLRFPQPSAKVRYRPK